MSCRLSTRILMCLLVCTEAVLREVTDTGKSQRVAAELAPDQADAVRRLFGKGAQADGNVCNWGGVKCTDGGNLDEEMDLSNVDGVSECAKAIVKLQSYKSQVPPGGKEQNIEYWKNLPWLTGAANLTAEDKTKLMQFRMQIKGYPVVLSSGSNPTSPQGAPSVPKSKLGIDTVDLRAFEVTIQKKYTTQSQSISGGKSVFASALYDEGMDKDFATIFGNDMVRAKVHKACERNAADSDSDKDLKDIFWRAVWTQYVDSWPKVPTSWFMGLEGSADTFEETDMYKYILPAIRKYQARKYDGDPTWKAKIYLTCASEVECPKRATCADYVKKNYFAGLTGTCAVCKIHPLGGSTLSYALQEEQFIKKTYIENGKDVGGKRGRTYKMTT